MPRRAYIACLASGRAWSCLQAHRAVRTAGRLVLVTVTAWARRSPAPAHSINGPPPITYRPVSSLSHTFYPKTLFQTNLLYTSSLGL